MPSLATGKSAELARREVAASLGHPIQQGARLVATSELECEDLPTQVQLAVTLLPRLNPQAPGPHLYFRTTGLLLTNADLLSLIKADQATHIDELIERLETETSSLEIFAALFALELNNKVRQMPGENFVKRVASSLGANIGEECSKTASGILVDSFRLRQAQRG